MTTTAAQDEEGQGAALGCPGCGALVIDTESPCSLCQADTGEAQPLVTPADSSHWVQIRLRIRCAVCSQYSPVGHLDDDGSFFCGSCGAERTFDVDLWKDLILPYASFVGDAFWARRGALEAWPDDGRMDDRLRGYKTASSDIMAIGVDCTSARVEVQGTTSLSDPMRSSRFVAQYAPGHPLCTTCQGPLKVALEKKGVLRASCAKCASDETHDIGDKVKLKDFLGALAPDHIQGHPEVRLDSEAGSAALTLLCGGCGAPLTVSAGQRLVQCSYCEVSSLIPDRIGARSQSQEQPEPWWLHFRSPSGVRKALDHSLRQKTQKAKAAEERKSRQQQRGKHQRERGQNADDSSGRRSPAESGKATPGPHTRAAIVLGVVLLVAGIGFFLVLR